MKSLQKIPALVLALFMLLTMRLPFLSDYTNRITWITFSVLIFLFWITKIRRLNVSLSIHIAQLYFLIVLFITAIYRDNIELVTIFSFLIIFYSMLPKSFFIDVKFFFNNILTVMSLHTIIIQLGIITFLINPMNFYNSENIVFANEYQTIYHIYGINYEARWLANFSLSGVPILRPAGWLDEPGFLGSLNGMILAYSLFFKRKPDYIHMLCGILSFSLAFYFLTFISLFLYYRWPMKLLMGAMVLILCAVGILYFPNFIGTALIVDRLIDFENNRETLSFMEYLKQNPLTLSDMLFGRGYAIVQKDFGYSAFIFMVANGMLLMFASVFLILSRLQFYNIQILSFMFIMACLLYQRPYFSELWFVVCMMSYLSTGSVIKMLKKGKHNDPNEVQRYHS